MKRKLTPEQEVRRAKIINYSAFGIVLALLLLLVVFAAVYRYQHNFNPKRWEQKPEERGKMLDSLLEMHDLQSLSRDDITALLGENDNDMGYFVQDDNFVYYLGPEGGLFSIDSRWLVINFIGDTVAEYYITTD